MVCVGSLLLVLPLPFNLGWFTTGDILVMLVGILFGPLVGLFAGGVGSALADIAVGFGRFAPYTFIAKGGEGFLSGLLLYLLRYTKRHRNVKVTHPSTRMTLIANLISAVLGGVWMVTSYFLSIASLYRPESALMELPSNILQAIIGVVVSVPLAYVIIRLLHNTFPSVFEEY